MKTIILSTGILLTCLNAILGILIFNNPMVNLVTTSFVIICNTILFYNLCISKIRDAYKISLSLLFLLLGIIEFVCGHLMPFQLKDNKYMTFIVIAIVFKTLLFMITRTISKIVKL